MDEIKSGAFYTTPPTIEFIDEMVERVARALYTHTPMRDDSRGLARDLCWEEAKNLGVLAAYRISARAAIAAMREPSKAMVRKAEFTSDMNMMDCPTIGWECATKLWQAMIDAALKE
jgi:hypothetical protein